MATVDPFFSFEDDGDFDEFYGPSRRTGAVAAPAPPSQEKQQVPTHRRVESVGKSVPVTPISNVSSFPSFSMPSTQGAEETERSAVSTASPGRQSMDGPPRRTDRRRVPRRRRLRQAEELFDVEWERDDDVASCFVCTNEFSLLRRKHHCRRCGRVICSDCSSFWRFGSSEKKKKHRVCTYCNVELAQHGKSQDPMARHTIVDVGVARHQSFSSDASFETPQAEKQLRFRKKGGDDFEVEERKNDRIVQSNSRMVSVGNMREAGRVEMNQQSEKTELFDHSDDTWFIEPVASNSNEASKSREATVLVDGTRHLGDANKWSSTRAPSRQTYGGESQVQGNLEELLHTNTQPFPGSSALRNPGDSQTFYGVDADVLVVDEDPDYYRATMVAHTAKGTPGYAPTPVPLLPHNNTRPDSVHAKPNYLNRSLEASDEPAQIASAPVESGKKEKKGFKNVIKRFFGLKSQAPETSEQAPSLGQDPTKLTAMEPQAESVDEPAPISRPSVSSGIPTSESDVRFTMIDDGRFVEPEANPFRHTIAVYQAPPTLSVVSNRTPAEVDTQVSTAIEQKKPKRLPSKKRRDTFDDLFESTASRIERSDPPQAAKLWSHVTRSSMTTGMTGVSRFDQRQDDNDEDDLTRALGLPVSSGFKEVLPAFANTLDQDHLDMAPSSHFSQIDGSDHDSRRSNNTTNSQRDRSTLLGEFLTEKPLEETRPVRSGVDDYFADFEKPKDYVFDTMSGSYVPANSQPRSRVDHSAVPSSTTSYSRTEIDTRAGSKLSVSMLAASDEIIRSTTRSSTPSVTVETHEVSGVIVDKISSLENEIRALKELLQNKFVSAPSSDELEVTRELQMNRSRKVSGRSAGPRKPSIFDDDSSEDENSRSKSLPHDGELSREAYSNEKLNVRSKPRSKARSRSKRKDSFAALFEDSDGLGGSQLASTTYESLFQTGGSGDAAQSSGSDENESTSTRRQGRRHKPSLPSYDDSTPTNGRVTAGSLGFDHRTNPSMPKQADATPAINPRTQRVTQKKKKKDAIDALFESDEDNDVVTLHQTSALEIAPTRAPVQSQPDPMDDSDEEFSSMLKLRKNKSNRSFVAPSISKASRNIFEDEVSLSHSSSDDDREIVRLNGSKHDIDETKGSRSDEMTIVVDDSVVRRGSEYQETELSIPEGTSRLHDDPDSDEEFATGLQQIHKKRLLSSSSLRQIKPATEVEVLGVDNDKHESQDMESMGEDSSGDERHSITIVASNLSNSEDATSLTFDFDVVDESGQLGDAPAPETEFDPLSFLEDVDAPSRLDSVPATTFVNETIQFGSTAPAPSLSEEVETVSNDEMAKHGSVAPEKNAPNGSDEEAATEAAAFEANGISDRSLTVKRAQDHLNDEAEMQDEPTVQGVQDDNLAQELNQHHSEDEDVVHLTRISRTAKYSSSADPHPLEVVSTDEAVSAQVEVSTSMEYQNDWQQMQAQEKERRRKLQIKQRQAQREKVKKQSTSSRSLVKGSGDPAPESASSVKKHRSEKTKGSKEGRHEKDSKRKKKRPSRSRADDDDQARPDDTPEDGALTEL
ncbi:hypothetical protein PINS_up002807 [Pythium insidiosum]|nr:hypothetical protein PINS_up002807 [Pythium insidiosum]